MRWSAMRRAMALGAMLLGLGGCGEEAPVDSCEPYGHIHRDPMGDYCHCFGAYRGDGLRCVLRGDGGVGDAAGADVPEHD